VDEGALAEQITRGVTVGLLADFPASMRAVADIRWQEWGHSPPESEDPAWWLATTIREAGRVDLPVTFVAHDGSGEVLGAVGLDTYDLDERHETSPWVTGMIVRRDRRGQGVGSALMHCLERWAAEHQISEAWVGTDLAQRFYERCGWTFTEAFTDSAGQRIAVLHKKLR
jgi:GNAT superfamily N-acetyltransferase